MFHLAAKHALKPDVAFRGAQRSISVQVAHMHSQGYHTQDMRQTLLHGSPDARRAGEIEIQQHSRLVARGKYVHGFEGRVLCMHETDTSDGWAVHRVKPESIDEYKFAACVVF